MNAKNENAFTPIARAESGDILRPLMLVAAVGIILWAVDRGVSYEMPWLLGSLNLIFLLACSLAAAALASRAFLANGSPGLLLIGMGVIVWGCAGGAVTFFAVVNSGANRVDINLLMSLHNSCMWISSLCHLIGALFVNRWHYPKRMLACYLVTAYLLAVALVAVVIYGAYVGWLPVFYHPQTGATTARVAILASAIASFAITGFIVRAYHRRHRTAFSYWHGLTLLLTAAGLTLVLVAPTTGGLTNWFGRLVQYGAGVCMIVATTRCWHDMRAPLPSARRQVSPWQALGVAVTIVIHAAVLRLVFLNILGDRFEFVTYYPAVIIAALYGGVRAGLLATFLATVIFAYFQSEPVGSLGATDSVDLVGMLLFVVSSALFIAITHLLRQAYERATAAENAAFLAAARQRLAEERERDRAFLSTVMDSTDVMLVQFDRDFNFMWVNQAYADACGMKPADLVGKNHFELYPHPENEAIFRRVRDTGRRARYHEKPFVFPDQPERGVTYWDWSLSPVKSGDEVVALLFALRETTQYVHTREALDASQDRYRRLFENMIEGFAIHDVITDAQGKPVDYRFLDVNPAFEQMTGLRAMDVIGRRAYEVIPGLEPFWLEHYSRVAFSGQPMRLEHRVEALGRWFEAYAYSPAPGQFAVVFSDITTRKQAEAALRESELRFRLALRNAPVSVAAQDKDLRYVWAYNQRTTEPGGIIGKRDVDIFTPEEARHLTALKRRVLDEDIELHEQMWLSRPNERIFVDVYFEPIHDDAGRVAGVGVTSVDLTPLKLAEESVRDSQTRLEAVFSAIPDAIVEYDADGKACRGNIAALRVLGLESIDFTRDDVAARLNVRYLDGSPVQAVDLPTYRALRGEQVAGEHYRIHAADRGERVIVTFAAPLYRDGEIRGAVGLWHDVTERKRVEDQLLAAKTEAERANSAKTRFLAAVSHDLRQPLGALALYCSVLEGKLTAGNDGLGRSIKDCVANLSDMLNNLLDISKLEAGVIQPEVRDFNIVEQLARLASTNGPKARAKGLRMRIASPPLVARTDPVLYARILGNLVSNAIRYTESGGVLVGVRRRDGKRWVEVWDTGIGIHENQTQSIFEEFFQLGNDERNRGKGSGLGLAIVARTAALLGLQLRLRSTPGSGSLFAVELPLGGGQAEMPVRRASGQQLRIAVVEDDQAVFDALVYSLQEVGHQVVAASSGSALLEKLKDYAPNVVVSDYALAEGETGLDVIQAVRSRFGQQIPGIVVTGNTETNLLRRASMMRVAIQHKPLELEKLQLCIEEMTAPARQA